MKVKLRWVVIMFIVFGFLTLVVPLEVAVLYIVMLFTIVLRALTY